MVIMLMMMTMMIMMRLTAKVMLEAVLLPIAHLRGGSGAPEWKRLVIFCQLLSEFEKLLLVGMMWKTHGWLVFWLPTWVAFTGVTFFLICFCFQGFGSGKDCLCQ